MLKDGAAAAQTAQNKDKNATDATAAAARRDARRAREFYRYLHPDHIVKTVQESPAYHLDKIPNLSQAFLPHCQLTTWRCRARKAMVNFMDRDVMYFVSESSMKKYVVNGDEHVEFSEDPILASCTSAPLEGKICEKVLHMESRHDRRPPIFVIPDLTKSPFSHMPIIAGPPYYRFYAGTPIRTPHGVSIGSLAIMDDKPRDCLTQEQEDFMANTANQIMTHLESHRQAVEGSRALRMTTALQTFFTHQNSSSVPTQPSRSRALSPQTSSPARCLLRQCSNPRERGESSSSPRKAPYGASTPASSSTLPPQTSVMSNTHVALPTSASRSAIIERAATLIQQCLDSANNVTVTFFSLDKNPLHTPQARSSKSSQSDDSRPNKQSGRRLARLAAKVGSIDAPVLAEPHTQSTSIDEEYLRLLATEYPDGHLWDLADDTSDSSNDAPLSSLNQADFPSRDRGSRRSRKENEIQTIRVAFPSAYQILFAPLWDADSALASYCVFVESDNEIYPFSLNTDLSFLRTFCNSITTEISKMEALFISKQKSDFVGTISHELRSPLHGILGSAEFLSDTDLTNFQRSLIKTIETCGNTLLDTLSHILDYSKINSFDKQWSASKEGGLAFREQAEDGSMGIFDENAMMGASPLSQAAVDTDMAAILEEVVDSLVRARTYTQNIDVTDVPPRTNGVSVRFSDKEQNEQDANTHPEVFVDIEPAAWVFSTHPGAMKRIFMNLAGNALKFTSQGTIAISLGLRPSPDGDQTEVMAFEVTDTGPGISPEFMNSKMFLPFNQENVLSPGTGLGLSIVYNIAKMLGGWVDVKSTLGVGTTVRVELPLKRSSPTQISTTRSGHIARPDSTSTSSIDSILAPQNDARNIKVALYPANENDAERRIVSSYVREWCHLQVSDVIQDASVIIVDERNLKDFIRATDGSNPKPRFIVICSETDRHGVLRNQNTLRSASRVFECVIKPCGPRKLARALRLVLDRMSVGNSLAEHYDNGQTSGSLNALGSQVGEIHLVNELPSINTDKVKQLQAACTIATDDDGMAKILDQTSQIAPNPVSDITGPENQIPQEGHRTLQANGDNVENTSPPLRNREKPSLLPQTINSHQQNGAQSPRRILTSGVNRKNTLSDSTSPGVSTPRRQPRVLLVDDNKVNLRLLETYLRKKRQYTDLTQAEDGQQAVDAFMASSTINSGIGQDTFDLIFMDISMPTMDGFTATRAIRQHEALRTPRTETSNPIETNHNLQKRTAAFIIAMTGLASARDQNEGYESGCDVYMTKPVSFKEVSKLLDQWEATQEASRIQGMNGITSPPKLVMS